ncbi:MAG: adenylate/guanylate cyclase domain-containing protein [Rhodocyclaceae bacterium]|nr:adenylate/guanylate cyclase domain-containing protein [Pseudomonadota bacterium]MDQ7973564.1 adenylate/guanylate cyclase domain-containing protein [Rhodocyclaceae bacterium]MDQ8001849.1 adenylate/guanylate cyclase domain-containing protein [Pseudomonadota bacterium]MDQ8017624.1 adenylate/guanylate cyclase domain-containing protein [Pseudomonadota bacterium]
MSVTAPSRPPRLRRFRVDVGTIITVVVLFQSLLLVAIGYWGSQRLVSTIGESAQRADHLRIEDKVNAFLAKAASVVDAVAAAPSLRPAGEGAVPTAELLWVLLQQSHELDSLYVANDAGRMLMVQRYPEVAVRHIVRESDFTVETWEYKPSGDDGRDIQQRYQTERISAFRTQYEPRARSWYVQATQRGAPVWTAPYVFAASQELGVTYAVPGQRRDRDGAQVLVAAGDVTLGRLSDFVRLFSRAGYGDSALLSADHQVLARSDQPGRIQALALPGNGVLGAIHARMLADGSARGTVNTAFPIDFDGQRYLVQTSRIPATNWRLISWVPEDKLLGGLRRAVLWSMLLVVAFLMLIVGVSLRLAQRVTAPVERLSSIARRIGRLELDGLPRVESRVLEIQHLDQALDDSARGLKAFRKFVPVDVVTQLVESGHTLGPSGEPRRITVMFTDVAGFTRIAEATPTEVLVRQMTRYFNLAAAVFTRHGGTIDKYIGDGTMVFWGAPSDVPHAEESACRAALELQAELDLLNAEWRASGLAEFQTRIGIHTGPAITGVLGSKDRLAYTAVGDTVNVASRIEGINKELGTRVLISETTFDGLAGRLPTRRIDAMTIRGRQKPLLVYELLEPAPPAG